MTGMIVSTSGLEKKGEESAPEPDPEPEEQTEQLDSKILKECPLIPKKRELKERPSIPSQSRNSIDKFYNLYQEKHNLF